MTKGILLLTPFFSPNIGGVETHCDALAAALDKRGYAVYVHTYSPITTPNTPWKSYERIGQRTEIFRYGWLGKNFFHSLEKYPLLDFFYLTPYLGIRTFFWLLFNKKKGQTIHAQGMNAAFIAISLKKCFPHLKVIVSTHAVYDVSAESSTAKRVAGILNQADHVLCLGKSSYKQMLSFGVDKNTLGEFRYWIDLNTFKPLWTKHQDFTVLFVGRLISIKGARVLTEVAKQLPAVKFMFIGTGPDEDHLQEQQKMHQNIVFIGKISHEKLPKYFSQADIVCVPSQYPEAFAQVQMEALACGLPVVASNKGALPEVLDKSVSILVDPTVENLKYAIEKLYRDKKLYKKLKINTRPYAKKFSSEKNVEMITRYY